MLVEQCAGLRHAQAVRAVAYWDHLADTDTERCRPPGPVSNLHVSTTFEGTVRVDGTFGAIDGAIVTAEVDQPDAAARKVVHLVQFRIAVTCHSCVPL